MDLVCIASDRRHDSFGNTAYKICLKEKPDFYSEHAKVFVTLDSVRAFSTCMAKNRYKSMLVWFGVVDARLFAITDNVVRNDRKSAYLVHM